MLDLLKKTLLAGVGLAAMTKDKVEAMAREVAQSADLSSDKGQEFVAEVMQRAEKAREDLESTIQKVVNENLRKTDLPSRDDISRLSDRLAALESRLADKSD